MSAGQLIAQALPATNAPEAKAPSDSSKPADVSSAPAMVSSGAAEDTAAPCRTWAQVEYLFWWLRNAPLPVPLVTTGNPNVGFDPNHVNTVNTAGAIGQPGTQILFGEESIHEQGFSGMRLTVGGWVD